MERAAFYFDGFNVYHAIDDLGAPHLKWVNYSALALRLIPKANETLVKVVVCTASRLDRQDKRERHEKLLRAWRASGIECVCGHFMREPRDCRACKNTWYAPVEKQGDVNLALHILDDGYQDVFDHCYLVTADSDQVATINMMKSRFPNKKITTVAPPGRAHSQDILKVADASMIITTRTLEASLLPQQLKDQKGVIVRPNEYMPPKAAIAPET